MRARQSDPARQLHSIALRYRWPHLRARAAGAASWAVPGEPERAAVAPPLDERLCRDAKLQRLEAVLFLAREPLSTRKLGELANLADGTEARTLIRKLNRIYDEGGRAFRVEEVAGGLQLLCRRKFAAWLRRLEHVPGEQRLSAPALETLAVIAYRQPVLRADIEAIRGVNCGEILRQLMDRDLVRISGRSEELGRPYLYSTTKNFLQLFGLPNIDKLPRVETMRNDLQGKKNSDDAGAGSETAAGHDSHHHPHQPQDKKESEVIVTSNAVLTHEEGLDDAELRPIPAIALQAKDDDDYEFEDEEELEDEEDDEFEFGDEDDDEEDEELDEEFDEEDEFEEEFAEDDAEDSDEEFDEEDDEQWEEVDDEEEEDEDWDDDDDDDEDWEEEEEEEEDWD